MKTLIFDTETSGWPSQNYPATHPSQPILLELGAQLWDDARLVGAISVLIKPYLPGRQVAVGALRAHGITIQRAEREGVQAKAALSIFNTLLDAADEVAAHNLEFDLRVIEMVYAQLRVGEPPWPVTRICTMQSGRPLAKAAGSGASLAELYALATERQLENAHSAAADCQACREVLLWLRREGALQAPTPPLL